MGIQCEKVSFRVSPAVKRGLQKVVEHSGLTLADLTRACLNVCLTGDRRYWPNRFERLDLSKDSLSLPPLHDTEGWRKISTGKKAP